MLIPRYLALLSQSDIIELIRHASASHFIVFFSLHKLRVHEFLVLIRIKHLNLDPNNRVDKSFKSDVPHEVRKAQ